ncbi:hypothetical protein ACOMHN_042456 [Nucella lapillus]
MNTTSMDATSSPATMTAHLSDIPAGDPPSHEIAVTLMWKICLPCILLLGTFGNVATIVVMHRIKDDNSSQRAFLMSLAVSDLSLLYVTVFTKWLRTVFFVDLSLVHSFFCKVMTWMVYALNTLSAWLITSVTVQRALAVRWPHRIKVLCTLRRTWIVIATISLTAFVAHFHFLPGVDISNSNVCDFVGWEGYFEFYLSFWMATDMAISSIIPTVCLLVCDVILSWTLFKASSSIAHSAQSSDTAQVDDSRRKAASKTTIMILTVSSTFLILTLPLCMVFILRIFANDITTEAVWSVVQATSMNMWYTNSAVNFLLYCLTGTRFRSEFLSLVRCESKGRGPLRDFQSK